MATRGRRRRFRGRLPPGTELRRAERRLGDEAFAHSEGEYGGEDGEREHQDESRVVAAARVEDQTADESADASGDVVRHVDDAAHHAEAGGTEHVACEGYGEGRGYEECEAVEQGEYYYRRGALGEDYQAEAGYAGEEAERGGAGGAEAVGEQACRHNAEESHQAHEGVEAAGEGGAEALVLGEGDDVGRYEEVLKATDGVHDQQQPELVRGEDGFHGERGGLGCAGRFGIGGLRGVGVGSDEGDDEGDYDEQVDDAERYVGVAPADVYQGGCEGGDDDKLAEGVAGHGGAGGGALPRSNQRLIMTPMGPTEEPPLPMANMMP